MLTTYLICYWLYFLSTCLLQLKYDRWNYHHYTIICHNTWSCKIVCGTIWGCATNKNYYYINVVCIQIVPHWGTNRECSINWGNTVYLILHRHNMHYTSTDHGVLLVIRSLYSLYVPGYIFASKGWLTVVETRVLHIKTSICTRIPIPKDRQTVFNNYPNVIKDQASEEIVLALFCPITHCNVVCQRQLYSLK